ncbi:Uncharacterized protein APZ42_020847 [Daphnia magna]|uniref:Uncharacterized protein n=1 Tax=Daphnia magna TaxID=35525 RepID=A0A164XFW2_9CRUS|nr:Uncharacterized protein APZ42_020847 [Daphnia magna]
MTGMALDNGNDRRQVRRPLVFLRTNGWTTAETRVASGEVPDGRRIGARVAV